MVAAVRLDVAKMTPEQRDRWAVVRMLKEWRWLARIGNEPMTHQDHHDFDDWVKSHGTTQ
jgi:hypothetical protein